MSADDEPGGELAPDAPDTSGGTAEDLRRQAARAALLADRPLERKLAAITGGDPLGLYALGAARARRRSLYLDPDRVHEESVFNVVALSVALDASEPFEAWLAERVDEALDNLVRRDAEALRRGGFDREELRASGEYLAGCWGLPPREALPAAARFNRLPERARRTFFALLVEHRSVEQCLREGLGPREELREHAVRAVEAILGPRPASVARCPQAGEHGPGAGPDSGARDAAGPAPAGADPPPRQGGPG